MLKIPIMENCPERKLNLKVLSFHVNPSQEYFVLPAYQPYVSATEFLNNKKPHIFFETFFFLKAYRNPYAKPQPKIKEVTQRRRQQQLLTYNTSGSKGYS